MILNVRGTHLGITIFLSEYGNENCIIHDSVLIVISRPLCGNLRCQKWLSPDWYCGGGSRVLSNDRVLPVSQLPLLVQSHSHSARAEPQPRRDRNDILFYLTSTVICCFIYPL